MRLVFLLLLLLNIALWPLASGLVSVGGDETEPLRMTSQISPERIRILPVEGEPVVAPQPVAPDAAEEADGEVNTSAIAPAYCRALAGLSREQADRVVLRSRELQPGVLLKESELPGSSSWWVHIPDLATRPLAERKQAELRALGVREMALTPDADGQKFAVSLGLFKTEAAARELLAQLSSQGVRSARIVEREGKPGRLRIALSGSEAEVSAVLADVQAGLEGVEPAECP